MNPHNGHFAQDFPNQPRISRGQQVGQIVDRDSHAVDRRENVVRVQRTALPFDPVRNRAERRHIPHHRQRPVFRMQRQSDPPLHHHFIDRRALRGLDPILRDAFLARFPDHFRVVRIKKDVHLRFIQVLLVLDRSGGFNLVRVIEHQPKIPNATNAGFRADRRQAGLNARKAERALLRLVRLPIEVHFLVRAAGYAKPPRPAGILVNQHDSVLFPLVHRSRWTG